MTKEIIKFIEVPYIVEKKKQDISGCILNCYSEQTSQRFKLKVCPIVYNRIQLEKEYLLPHVPIIQLYDSKGNGLGKPFMELSNF